MLLNTWSEVVSLLHLFGSTKWYSHPTLSVYPEALQGNLPWISAGSPDFTRLLLLFEAPVQGSALKYIFHPGPSQFLHLFPIIATEHPTKCPPPVYSSIL